MLGAFAFLTLVYKRQGEVPRRDFGVWFMDISKQGGKSYNYISWGETNCYLI